MIADPLVETDLSIRVAALEQRLRANRVAGGYARFYAALAVFSLFMTFIPLHRELDPDARPWPALWGLNMRNDSVRLGVVLIIAEIVILTLAAIFAPRGRTVPILVALLAVPEVLILVTGVGMPDDTEFSAAGTAAVVVAIVGIVVSLAAAVHVSHINRPHETRVSR